MLVTYSSSLGASRRAKRHGCRGRSAASSGASMVDSTHVRLRVYFFFESECCCQACASLEHVMKRQLELRREETRAIYEYVLCGLCLSSWLNWTTKEISLFGHTTRAAARDG